MLAVVMCKRSCAGWASTPFTANPRIPVPNTQNKVCPYLLCGMDIVANQVRALSYIPMARGFVYLTAVMDWDTRKAF